LTREKRDCFSEGCLDSKKHEEENQKEEVTNQIASWHSGVPSICFVIFQDSNREEGSHVMIECERVIQQEV
jgi:hypothetical protein